MVIARGTTVRLTDLDGDACAHLAVDAADEGGKRLSVAGAVRAPDQHALTIGDALLSDQGTPLATLTHDSTGRHDAYFGTPDLALFGRAAVRHGLGRRPLRSVSFFQSVTLDDGGDPVFGGSAGPGASVSIRAEVPLVVLVANRPHPLDPRPETPCGPLELLAWRDYCTSPGQPRRPRMG